MFKLTSAAVVFSISYLFNMYITSNPEASILGAVFGTALFLFLSRNK